MEFAVTTFYMHLPEARETMHARSNAAKAGTRASSCEQGTNARFEPYWLRNPIIRIIHVMRVHLCMTEPWA